jgi:hypothetical protein
MSDDPKTDDRDDPQAPDEDDGIGAENEHGDSAPAPFAPHEDDDTPLGDTDQHSDA